MVSFRELFVFNFIYLFLAVLSFLYGFSLAAVSGDYSLAAVSGLLTEGASRCGERALGAWGQ